MKLYNILLLSLLLLYLGPSLKVNAADTGNELDSSILDESELDSVDNSIADLFTDGEFDFKETVFSLMNGEIPFTAESMGELIIQAVSSYFSVYRTTIVQILLLVLVAALFLNFTDIFTNGQVSEVSFYIVYLVLFTVLIQSFISFTSVASSTMNGLITFMEAFTPVYFIVVAVCAGGVTAALFNQSVLLIILAVQWIMIHIMVPAVNIYVVLTLINHITKEEFLTKLAGLIKSAIQWTMKAMFTAVIGINVIQGLIAPAVDALKASTLTKTASALPGIGNVIDSVTEILLGSAVLIKNSIGIAAIIGLLILCGLPMLRLFAGSILYKVITAVIQPIADKRLLGCISSVGEGLALLLKVMTTTVALFFVTIAMIAAFTNRGY